MMDKPLTDLWVVIPTYNRSEDLMACLASLKEAGMTESQVIVVDNHSRDDTVARLEENYPGVKLFRLKENRGATGASNIGFDHALEQGAQFVLRLDSDTIVHPDFIDPLVQKALDDPQIGVIAPKIYYYEPHDEIWYAGADAHPWHFGAVHTHRHGKDSPQNSQPNEVDYTWGACMLIRGEVLKKTGGFDTDFFVYYEELDFCQRVKKQRYKIVYAPQSKIWHKVGSSANTPWTAYHWNRSKMLFYRKNARNALHRVGLILYAYLYAFLDEIMRALSLRKKSGNRGPFRFAIKGLWHGLWGKPFDDENLA